MTLPEPIPIERKCFCKGHGLEPILRNQEEKKDRERKLEGLYEEKEQV
jgi:hypothetical protein